MKLTKDAIKDIVKEELKVMQTNEGVGMTMLGGAALSAGMAALYNWFFPGEEPESEEQAAERIKNHVEQLQTRVGMRYNIKQEE